LNRHSPILRKRTRWPNRAFSFLPPWYQECSTVGSMPSIVKEQNLTLLFK
jgi:hypothetical protein